MARKNLILNLAIMINIVVSLLTNTLETKAASASRITTTQAITSETTCVYPRTFEQRVSCQNIETKILANTIRIEMVGWHLVGGQRLPLTNGGKSHATIVGGRYLVTHNHFKYVLTQVASADCSGYTGISLRTMDGKLVLENAPLSTFRIIYQGAEILVLEFADENGQGLFDSLGLASAQTIDWESVNWNSGIELAHIDWNGETAHVDWVVVQEVILNDGVPHVRVNNFAMKGASGGGVFLNGYHVGNIWARNLEKDPDSGEVTRLYTMIALNTSEVGRIN